MTVVGGFLSNFSEITNTIFCEMVVISDIKLDRKSAIFFPIQWMASGGFQNLMGKTRNHDDGIFVNDTFGKLFEALQLFYWRTNQVLHLL